LSPLPERFTIIILSLARVGASFIASAKAWALSSAGIIPSIFDKSLNIDRDKLINYMHKKNVDIRNFFYPNSMFPMFDEVRENVISYDIYKRGVNLPDYFEMTQEDIVIIFNYFERYLKNKRNS
jgi:dTDP-4-amino-4,6-dideoxygalactose transaminase